MHQQLQKHSEQDPARVLENRQLSVPFVDPKFETKCSRKKRFSNRLSYCRKTIQKEMLWFIGSAWQIASFPSDKAHKSVLHMSTRSDVFGKCPSPCTWRGSDKTYSPQREQAHTHDRHTQRCHPKNNSLSLTGQVESSPADTSSVPGSDGPVATKGLLSVCQPPQTLLQISHQLKLTLCFTGFLLKDTDPTRSQRLDRRWLRSQTHIM